MRHPRRRVHEVKLDEDLVEWFTANYGKSLSWLVNAMLSELKALHAGNDGVPTPADLAKRSAAEVKRAVESEEP